MAIDLSVIVVNWNTRDLLRDCLRSVEEHSGGLGTGVIVVDNGSSDGSPDMVREDFPAVRLVENGQNLGFARAVNRGLDIATGRHFLLLNSDTRVLPGSLESMVAFLDETEAAALCGPQLVNEDGSPQNSIANFPTLATELLNKSLLRLLFPGRFPKKVAEGETPHEVESVIGAAMMVKREAVEEVGRLDEDYFFFLEETDWCNRFREEGWKVYHLPAVRIVHLQGKSAEKVHIPARIEYFRSRYTYFRKHHGGAVNLLFRVLVPVRVFVNTAANGILSLFGLLPGRSAGRFRVYSRILGWHLAGCPPSGGLAAKTGGTVSEEGRSQAGSAGLSAGEGLDTKEEKNRRDGA